MYGRGMYRLVAVKQIKISENFERLSTDIKHCQTVETFEDCMDKQLLNIMMLKCGCIPYKLINFTSSLAVSTLSM